MIITREDGRIEFAYFRPAADQVSLAGDFNHWQTQSHPMKRDQHGWWRLTLALPDGEYRFKYVVNHHLWEADFAAYGVELNDLGGWTSVLFVNAGRIATRPMAA